MVVTVYTSSRFQAVDVPHVRRFKISGELAGHEQQVHMAMSQLSACRQGRTAQATRHCCLIVPPRERRCVESHG